MVAEPLVGDLEAHFDPLSGSDDRLRGDSRQRPVDDSFDHLVPHSREETEVEGGGLPELPVAHSIERSRRWDSKLRSTYSLGGGYVILS